MTMSTATTPRDTDTRDTDTSLGYRRHCAVPPYLLEHLSRHRSPTAVARTLELDEQVRERRHRGTLPERALIAPSGTLDRTISDAENTEELPGMTVRTEGQPPVEDVSVNEAYDGIGSVHAFLEEVYRQSSLDGAGLGLLATVHYGQRYDNAFRDGTQMVFGDGDGEVFTGFTPSASVIAHELAHGLMQYSTDLLYEGQSGALNESFSDVLGALVDQYAQGQTADQASWLIGAEIFGEGVQAEGLRSMAAPGTAYDDSRLGRDPQPAHMDDYVETQADYGGVHLNSGIPNKAFHLAAMALGGHAWERAGQVWFDVVTGTTLPRDAGFAAFAEATVLVAVERFDETVAAAIRAAWEQVGVLTDARFEVTVERSGGIAGMVRRWSAPVPDDGGPAARAAHRIAELNTTERGTEGLGPEGPGHEGPGRVRDSFIWAVSCGEGSLQCDEEGRRRDPDVDALITMVTTPP